MLSNLPPGCTNKMIEDQCDDSKILTIDVTLEDIRHGVREDGGKCPIARAVRRVTGRVNVQVESSSVEIDSVKFRPTTSQGKIDMESFVNAFDAGITVTPFTLELEPVE